MLGNSLALPSRTFGRSSMERTAIRVLTIVDEIGPAFYGGGARAASELVSGLTQRGFDITVVCGEGRAAGVEVISMTPRQVWQREFALSGDGMGRLITHDQRVLEEVFTRVQPEIILVLHGWGLPPRLVAFASTLPVRRVFRFGDEWLRLRVFSGRYYDPLAARTFEMPDLAICNSKALLRRVELILGRTVPTRVISNGVDLDLFSPTPRTPQTPIKLLFVGRPVQHKGILLALAALSALRRAGIEVILTVAGGAPADKRVDLRGVTADLDVEFCVFDVGNQPRPEIARLMRTHDVFLFPSMPRPANVTVEGCPTVLLEAIAANLPIVAVDSDAVRELLWCDSCGHIVTVPPDPEALAAGVCRAIENSRRRRLCPEMSDRRLAYSFPRMIDDYAEALRGVTRRS